MPRTLARVTIWALFLVTLFGGATLAHTDVTSTSAAPAPVLYADSTTTNDQPFTPAYLTEHYSATGTEAGTGDVGNPLKLLPAYRWNPSAHLHDALDLQSDTVAVPLNAGATLLFGLAQVLWTFTLWLLSAAMTLDVISGLADDINSIFATVADGLMSSGLIIVAFAVVALIAARMAIGGRLTRTIALGIAFIVPVAALQFLAAQAQPDDTSSLPTWSPAWIAVSGSQAVNDVSSTLTLGLTERLKLTDATALASGANGVNNSVACPQFTSALYSQFGAVRNGGATPSATKPVAGSGGQVYESQTSTVEAGGYALPANAYSMVLVSNLWEESFLHQLVDAQFESREQGAQMVCKQMEMDAGVPAEDSYAVVGGTLNGKTATPPPKGAFTGWGLRPFSTYIKDTHLEAAAQVFAWAACRDNAGQEPAPGWADMKGTFAPSKEQCTAWSRSPIVPQVDPNSGPDYKKTNMFLFGIDQGGKVDPGESLTAPRTPDQLNTATAAGPDDTPAQAAALDEVHTTIDAYWGHNASARIMAGLIAALSAGLYLWAFGFLGLGVILAQFALTILLVLLPVSLIIAAFPTQGRRSSNPGVRMLKITGGMLLTKAVLMFTITLMIIMTTLLAKVDSGLTGGSGLLTAVSPIVAFLVLRYVYKQAGLGGIMSPGGALGLTTGAAMRAIGDDKAASQATGAIRDGQKMAKRGIAYTSRKGRELASTVRDSYNKNQEKTRREEQRILAAKEQQQREQQAAKARTPEELAALSASRQRAASEALSNAAGGKTAAVTAALEGSSVALTPAAGSYLDPKGRINDKGTLEALAVGAGVGAGMGVLTREQRAANQERQRELQRQGLSNLAMDQGLDGAPQRLTDEERQQRLMSQAALTGISPSDYQQDNLPLAPVLSTGASQGEFPVLMDANGGIDYSLTQAGVGATAALSTSITRQTIPGIAAEIHARYQGMFTYEDCVRATTHAVMFDAGLCDASGIEVDPFLAAGMSDSDVKKAIEDMVTGKVCAQLKDMADAHEQRVKNSGGNWRGDISINVEHLLDGIAANPIVSMDALTSNLTRKPEVIQAAVSDLTDLADRIRTAQGQALAQARDEMFQRLGELPYAISDADRSSLLAATNLDLSANVLSGRTAEDRATITRSNADLVEVRHREQELIGQIEQLRSGLLAEQDIDELTKPFLGKLVDMFRQADADAQSNIARGASIHDALDQIKPRKGIEPSNGRMP